MRGSAGGRDGDGVHAPGGRQGSTEESRKECRGPEDGGQGGTSRRVSSKVPSLRMLFLYRDLQANLAPVRLLWHREMIPDWPRPMRPSIWYRFSRRTVE